MRAVSTAGGGVMFIPEKLERKDAAKSFADILEQEMPKTKRKLFGRRSVEKKANRKAA